MRCRLAMAWLITVPFYVCSCQPQTEIPEPRKLQVKGSIGLSAVWEDATVVVLGRLENRVRLGPRQAWIQIDKGELPVYPCTGTISNPRYLKGDRKAEALRLLWFSYRPLCSFSFNPEKEPSSTEGLWLLRTEGQYVRPVWDNGPIYVPVYRDIEQSADLIRVTAERILDPSTVSRSQNEFLSLLLDHFELSCSMVGVSNCRHTLRDLALRSDSQLRGELCRFRAGMHDECSAGSCPSRGFFYPGDVESLAATQSTRIATTLKQLRSDLELGTVTVDVEQLIALRCLPYPQVRQYATALLRRRGLLASLTPCVPCT